MITSMTIVTKVGASNDDHMNDDAPEVDSFSRANVTRLSPPPVFEERAWGRGYAQARPNKLIHRP